MTAFNFLLQPDFITIVSDTLNCVGPQNRPYLYNSKLHVVPHLHAIVGGTGQGLFHLECHKALMMRLIVRDIVDADPDVPELFRELWQNHCELCSRNGEDISKAKATMYHFGWVETEKRMVAFEYKSGSNFRSERIADGCWLHPNTVTEIIVRQPVDLVQITLKQKEIDDALPTEKRAGIGGDIHLIQMTKDAIVVQPAHRCSDFDDVYRQMVEYSEQEAGKDAGN